MKRADLRSQKIRSEALRRYIQSSIVWLGNIHVPVPQYFTWPSITYCYYCTMSKNMVKRGIFASMQGDRNRPLRHFPSQEEQMVSLMNIHPSVVKWAQVSLRSHMTSCWFLTSKDPSISVTQEKLINTDPDLIRISSSP